MKEIFSIEKGWGESSTYFTADPKREGSIVFVNEIRQEMKDVGPGSVMVYRGYLFPDSFKDNSTKLVFEIEAGSQLTLIYK